MARHAAASTTQQAYPWRATLRTVVAYVIGAAALAPAIYSAATQGDPDAAVGWAAAALAVAGAVTRIAAIPAVDALLSKVGLGSAPEPIAAADPRETE